MALSLALILFLGMIGSLVVSKLKLPGLLGMLVVGMIIGPYGIDLLDDSILIISADLRRIALIIILIRAGLGIKRKELKQVGRTAIVMSFIPGLLEGITIAFLAVWLLDFHFIVGGILGFIIAAVSPAVVVPFMLKFIEERIGMKKGIPVLVLSASSIDDVIAITIFSSFMGFYANQNVRIGLQLFNIPVSIILGIILGVIIGSLLMFLFNKFHIRDSKKVILIFSIAIFMVSLESFLEPYILIASLLGVMTVGFILADFKPALGLRLSVKFNKIWLLAEIYLFVLVGAEVNVHVALDAGLIGLAIIALGLVARSAGVLIATIKSGLSNQEKLFTVIAYWPKATVQAAIGAIPLQQGVRHGELILAIAVLSIIVTAPLGASLIHTLAPRLLKEST